MAARIPNIALLGNQTAATDRSDDRDEADSQSGLESESDISSQDAVVTVNRIVVSTTTTTTETVVETTKSASSPSPSSKAVQQPINFGTVAPGLYRSGYPQTQDYPFLQSLGLKTIVTLVSKELPDGYQGFMDANGITHKVFDMAGTKKQVISLEMMQAILGVVTDRANYPLLIHCNHGKHRTGCVVGLIRKASEWEVPAILQEYTQYASPKVRETDIEYLTKFNLLNLEDAKRKLVIKSTTTTTTVRTHANASPPSLSIGNFLFFVFVASIALCIFVFTGRTFPRTPAPAPRRRETGS